MALHQIPIISRTVRRNGQSAAEGIVRSAESSTKNYKTQLCLNLFVHEKMYRAVRQLLPVGVDMCGAGIKGEVESGAEGAFAIKDGRDC